MLVGAGSRCSWGCRWRARTPTAGNPTTAIGPLDSLQLGVQDQGRRGGAEKNQSRRGVRQVGRCQSSPGLIRGAHITTHSHAATHTQKTTPFTHTNKQHTLSLPMRASTMASSSTLRTLW